MAKKSKRKRNEGDDAESAEEGALPDNLAADGSMMPKVQSKSMEQLKTIELSASEFKQDGEALIEVGSYLFPSRSPSCPDEMDWSVHFPEHFDPPANLGEGSISKKSKRVEWVDIGCGFGGLVCALAPLYPDILMLGMEIRMQVTQFVQDKIVALRRKGDGQYQNLSVIRANTMKFLPNFLEKGQLTKMFFLFPDPHFKARKHKARIITSTLLAEYAYVLRPGGFLYTITDVQDLNDWMVSHLEGFPAFERIPEDQLVGDDIVEQVKTATEEGKKVKRNNGLKMVAVYRRIVM
ncbi:MAG: tRNA (guanine-N(7)-)-methyltransferase (tRNA(m7G46)-methyltransferase) [Cyphobasidiales sp. Tagirdzhanova-0007]|nr:MAG: tRNA (guanine-N(7)-)-methyltransferase (tRNA(m7G46)-methyltransferase) [Cyphobasidiales sp. Tagirdzhanova-0007]